MSKYPLILCFIIYLVSHYVQVLHLFTFHYIFSVPFWASSPIALCFIISSVSHYVHVPYLFTFHYILSVPLFTSSPYFYISLYIWCPIMCKFPNFLCFVISSVSHCGQVPNNFVLHYIFSVPLCASSLSFYLSLFPLCTIMCKFSFFLPFIICSVSHYVQVLHLFTFHYIFSVPLWASSLSIYISLDLQCPILGKYPIILCFIIYLVSHYVQVPYFYSSFFLPFIICSVSHYVQVLHLFTFHYIFSVPLCASSISIYISLDLQCPIMCKFSIFFHFIISLVSHFGQVPYLFTFHQIFSVPFVQVPYLFTFHYIFSVVFWASSLSIYISLYLQCLIMCKFTIFLRFIIYLVSHYVQVPYNFTFHYIFSVPFCASSLTSYVSLYLQCPIMCKFPIFLPFIISLVSHSYVLVPSF